MIKERVLFLHILRQRYVLEDRNGPVSRLHPAEKKRQGVRKTGALKSVARQSLV